MRLFFYAILARKGVVLVEHERIQALLSQNKEGIIVDAVLLVNESLVIQVVPKDFIVDVRLLFGDLTVSVLVVLESVDLVDGHVSKSLLLRDRGALIVEEIDEGLLTL